MANDALHDDEIARCLIYSRFFPGSIHTNRVLWPFEAKNKNGHYEESAVLRSKTPNDLDVHNFGCGLAAHQNAHRLGNPPPGDKKRRYYCAFRNAKVADLPLNGDDYEIDLENDHDAHVAVTIKIEASERNEQRTIATDAGLALAEAFGPLVFHKCECDAEDEHHPITLYGEKKLSGTISQ